MKNLLQEKLKIPKGQEEVVIRRTDNILAKGIDKMTNYGRQHT